MAKGLVIAAISLVVLVVPAGCSTSDIAQTGPPPLDTTAHENSRPEAETLKLNESAAPDPETQPEQTNEVPAGPEKPEPPSNETDPLSRPESLSAQTEPNNISPAPAEPNDISPPKPEIPKQHDSEPPKTDPNEPPPKGPSQDQTEPNNIEPTGIDPNDATTAPPEPNQPDPNDLIVSLIDPNSIDPPHTEPNDIEPPNVEPNDIDVNSVANPVVEPNDPNTLSAASFHDKCAAIFKKYVTKDGMVDYKTLDRRRLELKAVLNEFNKLDPAIYESWTKEDKIAFWINAYNLHMLDIITRNYPIKPASRILLVLPGWGPKSIRHISGIWTRYKFMVMEEQFWLSLISERFFRKEFNEPRTFFALTRASLSGPPLRNEPYYGGTLYEQLDDQAKKFLAGPLAFKIDKNKGKVYLSALFQKSEYTKELLQTYGTDKKFKLKEPEIRAVLNFITNYVSEEVKSYLDVGNYTIQFMGYNWNINETP